jgi:VIT1/CCC1 family predicted Fe2+/Mn2+ transporter
MPSVFRRLWAERRARIRQHAATRAVIGDGPVPMHEHDRDAGLMSWFGPYIGSMVYGGLDGIVTTFAVVSGVAGANLGAHIIVILGIGNLIADGFSMATGDYLSTKSEREYYDREARRQAWEIERAPEGRRAALRALYQRNGYSETEADEMVAVQTREKPRWVRAMMINELGMMKDDVNPMRNAVTTFTSFVLAGSLPLVVYLIGLVRPIPTDQAFRVSVLLSGLALFGLGAAKVLVTRLNPVRSGVEMLLVGGLAAVVAYIIGDMLQNVGR